MRNYVFILVFMLSSLFANAAEPYDVSLAVDVSNFSDSVSLVKVNGGFSGWSAYELTNTSGDIWEVVVPMNEGTTDYRFEIIDTADGWHPEWPSNDAVGICFVNGNMRTITVSKDSIMDTVCWESCTACEIATPLVTVSIDMASYSLSVFNEVMVNGGFNAWGPAYQLTNTSGTIWTATIPMAVGEQDYRFEINGDGGWAAEWPGDAAVGDCFDGAHMRLYTVTEDVVLPTVCWESCSDCVTIISSITGENQIKVFVADNRSIVLNGLSQGLSKVSIYDIQGRLVLGKTVHNQSSSFNMVIDDNLNKGLYIIRVENADIVYSAKVLLD